MRPELVNRRWDVIVIGAGPAGAVAAHGLAMSGCSVLLLDKSAFPREKVCGCCLSAEAMASLLELGLAGTVEKLAVPLHQLSLRAGSARAEISLSGGVALSRATLDHFLAASAAAAGASFVTSASAVVCSTGPLPQVQVGSHRLGARALVVADGLGGMALRDHACLRPTIRSNSYIGLGATLPGTAPAAGEVPPGTIAMHIGHGGYVGMVRLGSGALDIAAAIDPKLMRSVGSPAAAVESILSSCNVRVNALNSARFTGTARLWRRRPVESGRALVVGDAASYIEPFTGQGIGWAILSGARVVEHILTLLDGRYRAGDWSRAHASQIRSRQLACSALSLALRRPRLTAAGIRLSAALPQLASAVAGRLHRPERCTG